MGLVAPHENHRVDMMFSWPLPIISKRISANCARRTSCFVMDSNHINNLFSKGSVNRSNHVLKCPVSVHD